MRSAIVASVALLLCAATTPAHAYCRLTTESGLQTPGARCVTDGEILSWRRRCMSIALDRRGARDLATEEVRRVLERSYTPWEMVRCSSGEPIGFAVRVLEEPAHCDGAEFNQNGAGNVNAVTFVDDWKDRGYPETAMALTFVWFSKFRGEIFDADLEVNQQFFQWSDCDGTCPPGRADLQNAITHEAGHFFGLGHSEDRTSTMAPGAEVGELMKRDLEEDDVQGICATYPPMAVPATCDDTPVDGLELVCGAEPGCSCHIPGRPTGGRGALLFAGFVALGCLFRRSVRGFRQRERGIRR